MHIRTGASGFPAIAAAIWMLGSGPVWAGSGGADAGSVQSFLDSICSIVAPPQVPCPQLPTVSQGVLEIAGLFNARPEAIRYDQNVTGTAVYAGNTLAQSPVGLSSLTPLAFVGPHTANGPAIPTQLFDPKANSFFFAVTTAGEVDGVSQPQTLNLSYDYLLRTVPVFIKGQTVAKISLPLAVLKADGSEYPICGAAGCPASVATLTITATCTGGSGCLKGEVAGDFKGDGKPQPSRNAGDLGITFSAAYGPSPLSKLPHATFDVQVPLLVTAANDPPYFGFSPITGNATFVADQIGHVVPDLGSVGIPPYAAPQCLGGPCPTPPSPPPPATFGFCASFSNNFTGPFAKPAPAVAAVVQIGTDGETLVSAPLPPVGAGGATCPF